MIFVQKRGGIRWIYKDAADRYGVIALCLEMADELERQQKEKDRKDRGLGNE